MKYLCKGETNMVSYERILEVRRIEEAWNNYKVILEKFEQNYNVLQEYYTHIIIDIKNTRANMRGDESLTDVLETHLLEIQEEQEKQCSFVNNEIYRYTMLTKLFEHSRMRLLEGTIYPEQIEKRMIEKKHVQPFNEREYSYVLISDKPQLMLPLYKFSSPGEVLEYIKTTDDELIGITLEIFPL